MIIDLQDSKQWKIWLKGRSFLSKKIVFTENNIQNDFLSIHAGTEAALRRLLFIGLRLNGVRYAETNNWIFHHDKTPNKDSRKGSYIYLFNKLYTIKSFEWQDLLNNSNELNECWELWNEFSKVIRNHISHSVRNYADEWLEVGIMIDKGFLFHLDSSVTKYFIHSPFLELSEFNPRIPRATIQIEPHALFDIKISKPRPKVSLQNTKARLNKIIS